MTTTAMAPATWSTPGEAVTAALAAHDRAMTPYMVSRLSDVLYELVGAAWSEAWSDDLRPSEEQAQDDACGEEIIALRAATLAAVREAVGRAALRFAEAHPQAPRSEPEEMAA